MRVVLQRASRGRVTPSNSEQSSIQQGLVLLVGFTQGDEQVDLDAVVRKLTECRIFSDENGRFQHNIIEIGGEILVVPQFTLYANTGRGRRPDFGDALAPAQATQLFDAFVEHLKRTSIPIVTGVFGANMAVELVNDGPVTLIFDF